VHRVLVGASRVCLLAGALLAQACSLGPTYRRPDVAMPEAWRGAPVEASTDWPRADWWRGFGSSQLNDYISQAQAANYDIAAAMARVREADAQARIAGAALLPTLGATAAATRERQVSPSGAPPTTYTLYTPQLAASYQVDFWGKNRVTHEAALESARASRYDRDTITLTVVTSVALTYFEALELHDRLSVAQNNLANAQHILQALEFEQNVGTVTALDVAQQATTVATVNASIPPLLQGLQEALDALAILIAQPPERVEVADGSLTQLTPPPVGAGMPSALLARRPDVAESEAQLKSANANIAAARAAFFPNVNLTATGGFASTALGTLLSPQSRVFALTAGATQAIFEGGALRGQYQYTQARYAELLSDYHKTVLTALGNVEDSLAAVQQTAEQQRRQQDAADKAQRAYDFAQMQMQAGTTNILTVLNTETALFTAQDNLALVRFQHLQALVDLYQALGGGWQQTEAQ
jgi:multidrug efflux system outer membrane protein